MKEDINTILFLLQTLHFREDLETKLFENLDNKRNKTISKDELEQLYGQRVHEELLASTQVALKRFGVLLEGQTGYEIDLSKLDRFKELIQVAKASREYNWPPNIQKPFLFVSPPNLIAGSLAGDIDDISNLIINLVRSATLTISIMSPYTNKEGMQSVLAPLRACKNEPEISLYLTASEEDKEMIYSQVYNFIPQNMVQKLKVYFCSPEQVKEDSQPHAKVLIIDSVKGYLGSANFTKQGLTTRFELGVELLEQQSKTINKLLQILVEKKVFNLHSPKAN